MESPGSPLSDALSDAPPSLSASPEPDIRPTKRQRISTGATKKSKASREAAAAVEQLDDMVSANDNGFADDVALSEDTEGSVSGSVHGLPTGMNDDDDDKNASGQPREQVSVCRWEECEAGDQGNMDLLVKHLHEEHIHARQKKYSCEWVDCPRKGHPHASGYALRAHMRSHTREKPFYCTLPECDRSFTRSDALAKHMRTVHETEAQRPADHPPRYQAPVPTNKSERIRLSFNKSWAGLNGTKADDIFRRRKIADEVEPAEDQAYAANHATWTRNNVTDAWVATLPTDARFTAEEESGLTAQQLYMLVKKQVEWCLEERDELDRQLYAAEKRRKGEWIAKEMVLADALAMAQAAAPPEEEEQDEDEAVDAKTTAALDEDEQQADNHTGEADDDLAMDGKSEHEQAEQDAGAKSTQDINSSPPPPARPAVTAELPPLPYSNAHLNNTAAASSVQAQTNGVAAADG